MARRSQRPDISVVSLLTSGQKPHIQPLSAPRWKPFAETVAWVELSGPCSQTQIFWQDMQELLQDMHALDLLLCMSLPSAYDSTCIEAPQLPPAYWKQNYPNCWHCFSTLTLSSYRITAFTLLWSLLSAAFRFLENYQLFLRDKQALPIQSYPNNHHWAWAVAAADFPSLRQKGNARSEIPAGTEYLDILPCLYSMANCSIDMDPNFLRN